MAAIDAVRDLRWAYSQLGEVARRLQRHEHDPALHQNLRGAIAVLLGELDRVSDARDTAERIARYGPGGAER